MAVDSNLSVTSSIRNNKSSQGKAIRTNINAGKYQSSNVRWCNTGRGRDVVDVSVNYRVHAFRFSAAPFLKDKNPGLLGQRLGLEWVRNIVENFEVTS